MRTTWYIVAHLLHIAESASVFTSTSDSNPLKKSVWRRDGQEHITVTVRVLEQATIRSREMYDLNWHFRSDGIYRQVIRSLDITGISSVPF
jgi:peptidyl-tRNA hydrolase